MTILKWFCILVCIGIHILGCREANKNQSDKDTDTNDVHASDTSLYPGLDSSTEEWNTAPNERDTSTGTSSNHFEPLATDTSYWSFTDTDPGWTATDTGTDWAWTATDTAVQIWQPSDTGVFWEATDTWIVFASDTMAVTDTWDNGLEDTAWADTDTHAGGEDPSICTNMPTYTCDAPCVRLVNVSANGAGDGMVWDSAYKTLQEGIDDAYCEARACNTSCQVWVRSGTYYVYKMNREDTVQLRPDVEIYGGFVGSETALSERDWKTAPTVIDGHAGQGDGRQVYHVVMGADNAIIDGFTITGGQTEGEASTNGGGMLNMWVSPTVRNCTFTDNSAMPDGNGGAVGNMWSSAVFENCIFKSNSADWGGAVYNRGDSSLPLFSNVLFHGNSAREGGAAYNIQGASAYFANCTFTENTAEYGGGIYNDDANTVTITNTILYGDGLYDELYVQNSTVNVTYSNVKGNWQGTGNIDSDPLFVDPSNGDYRLGEGSPCIDAANPSGAPSIDIDGNARGTAPDMGAYERVPTP